MAWSRRGDGWWKQRFHEGFFSAAATSAAAAAFFCLWSTFICARQPLGTKRRSPAHWLRFNVFIYSFIYLFSLGFPPSDAHCLLSSLFSPPSPLHSPRFISTERRERPDEVINTLVQFAAVQRQGCGYLPCANWTCDNRHASLPLMGNGYTTPHRRL